MKLVRYEELMELSRRLESIAIPAQDRLPKLWEIHKIYVGQDYVKNA